jgi:hypothetical protein
LTNGSDGRSSARTHLTRAVGAFRNPATTFLVVAGTVGVLLVFLVPSFAGIDEGGHLARAYQMSTGHFVPDGAVTGAPPGGGACLPADVAAGITREGARYRVHVFGGVEQFAKQLSEARTELRSSDAQLAATLPACGAGERFWSFSTFAWYSPLPYLPQAAAVGVVRLGGGGVVAMLLAARLASLLAYVGIAWVAIRRAPAGRWALCITALLPVALFQGASVSPDAVTTAVALLVISSALRMTAAKPPKLPRAFLVEAALLSVALGLCKPSYVVVALCYLLPLLGPARRLAYWPLGIAVALGVGVSALWQTSKEHLFVCDSGFFGGALDPAQQRHSIVTNPARLVGAGCRAVVDYRGKWSGDLVTIGARVVDWRVEFAVLVLIGFLFLAVQRDPTERLELHWQQRVFVSLVFVVAYFAVITGWIIYCEAPPVHVGIPPHARLFLPALALIPLALEIPRGKLGRMVAGRVPITVLVVPFEVAWLVALGTQMR